ncbi:MAG TPA: efflux RND transporter permease subunit, partial [Thermoanaerobaculia bacterium]|nr:efflux RND transporter permease subunit [Thermoanaerobaculia bacterium]
FGYLGEALLLAIIFVYLILAAQFESFVDPLAIMFSLPLSIVGMAGMLALTRDTVNMMSLIGLILLMGLVTKNAILLVDYSKELRARGMERREALILAGRTRLRPIMMTTLAMIFGMTPLAMALGQGAEMRAPMARAVIGGLITSTLLTLIVVPVVYTILDDFAVWIRKRWHAGAVPVPAIAKTGAVVVALLFIAVSVSAQPLTLDRALAIAQEHNRDLQKAREYQQWVHGKYLEERAAALPKITATGGSVQAWDNTYQIFFGDLYPASQRTYAADVAVSQVLFAWGKVGASITAAREGIESAHDQLEIFRQGAVRDVTTAFTDVLLARELDSIASATLAQRERHLAEAKHRYELGVATDYDVLSATVAVDNARPEVIHAQSLVKTAFERLRFAVGDPELIGDVTGTLDLAVAEPPSYDEVIGEALKRRPDLLELEHRQAVYDQLVRIVDADSKPRLDFRAAYGWKGLTAGTLTGQPRNWNAGVFLSFPAFDGFASRGRVIQAESDRERQRIDSNRMKDGVTLEARTTVDSVREAAAIVRALSGTVEQAKRLLQMAEQGYELGVKTQIEVQDAELNLRTAEGNLARARRDYRVALVNLGWVRGAL